MQVLEHSRFNSSSFQARCRDDGFHEKNPQGCSVNFQPLKNWLVANDILYISLNLSEPINFGPSFFSQKFGPGATNRSREGRCLP
jgi:hypothetical protein